MYETDIIDDIHDYRQQLAERLDFDAHKIAEYIRNKHFDFPVNAEQVLESLPTDYLTQPNEADFT